MTWQRSTRFSNHQRESPRSDRRPGATPRPCDGIERVTYDAVPLVPRELLFGNPERVSPSLSPDGTRLGFIAPVDGVLNVWVGPADDPPRRARSPTTEDRGIRSYVFCHDDAHLVYLQDTDGDEDWRLYVLDLETGESELVTPGEEVHAPILGHNRWNPQTMLVGLNADNPQLHDVYRLDLADRCARQGRGQPRLRRLADRHRPRGARRHVHDRRTAARSSCCATRAIGARRSRAGDPSRGRAHHRCARLLRDGSALLLMTSVDANASRLVRLDLATGEQTEIAEDAQYDVGGVVLASRDARAAGGRSSRRTATRWCSSTDLARRRSRAAAALGRRRARHLSRSERSDRRWLVTVAPSRRPGRVLHVRPRHRDARLSCSRTSRRLDDYELAPMEPFVFTARDGLEVHGYVTFPPGIERRGPARRARRARRPVGARRVGLRPGGAVARQSRLRRASRSTIRGSVGYGKAFTNAGDKQWGAAMHDRPGRRGRARRRARLGRPRAESGSTAARTAATPRWSAPRSRPTCSAARSTSSGRPTCITLIESIPEYWQPQIALFHASGRQPGDRARLPLGALAAVAGRRHPHPGPGRAGRQRPAGQAGRGRADRRGAARRRGSRTSTCSSTTRATVSPSRRTASGSTPRPRRSWPSTSAAAPKPESTCQAVRTADLRGSRPRA